MHKHSTSPVRTFVVIQPDPVVSLDLVETLKNAFPDSAINLYQRIAEATQTIAAAPASVCLLVSSSLLSDMTSDMLRDFVMRGARLVFVGSVENVDFPAAIVDMPFTTDMIMDVLS